ncbi:MAG: hypothetical protein OSA97_06795 [Nevskia sp.]|nr:hypothetical protein [Nevskia sp.]
MDRSRFTREALAEAREHYRKHVADNPAALLREQLELLEQEFAHFNGVLDAKVETAKHSYRAWAAEHKAKRAAVVVSFRRFVEAAEAQA